MLGTNLVMTSGINEAILNKEFHHEVLECLIRYMLHDWGDLCEEDKQANDDAFIHDERILAKYSTSQGDIYIITEWDRSATTILFTEEY